MQTIPSIYDTAMSIAQSFYTAWRDNPMVCKHSLQEALRTYAYMQRHIPLSDDMKQEGAQAMFYIMKTHAKDVPVNNDEHPALAAYVQSALWYLASPDEKRFLMIENTPALPHTDSGESEATS